MLPVSIFVSFLSADDRFESPLQYSLMYGQLWHMLWFWEILLHKKQEILKPYVDVIHIRRWLFPVPILMLL